MKNHLATASTLEVKLLTAISKLGDRGWILLLGLFASMVPQPVAAQDDGKTWQQMPERVEFGAGRLFLHEEKPYFLGVGPDLRGDIRISRSKDGGRTWAEPVTLFEEHKAFYNPSTSMAKSDGKLYWTFGAPNTEGERNTTGSRLVVVAGDLTAELMDPQNNMITFHRLRNFRSLAADLKLQQ